MIDLPNAWIAPLEEMGGLLDRVFHARKGEIWLFDNDLAAFEQNDAAFKELYIDRIDGCWSHNILCIKILVRRALYDRILDDRLSPSLHENLRKLNANRLQTFYFGVLEDVNPPPTHLIEGTVSATSPTYAGSPLPWILYVGGSPMTFNDSIIVLRPRAFPFHDSPAHLAGRASTNDVAVGWPTNDDSATLLSQRAHDWFRQAFAENAERNFRSLLPSIQGKKIVKFELVAPLSLPTLKNLHARCPTKHTNKIVQPVDVAIITALEEEFDAAVAAFGLTTIDDKHASGWCQFDARQISIVARRCDRDGSVEAAVHTASIIEQWRPKCIFLLGRCGAFGIKPDAKNGKFVEKVFGDVLYARDIMAYEYQRLQSKKIKVASSKRATEPEIQFDFRSVPVSQGLITALNTFARTWAYKKDCGRNYPARWRKPKASAALFASGSKVVRLGIPWFDTLRTGLGQRKVEAVEMEGEGVGLAVRFSQPTPQFAMIKSISDFADHEKDDRFSKFASETSVWFLKDFLESKTFAHYFAKLN